jgi:DNA-directed RNA polymerase subunit M/transcription elongation factor TFIIS
MFFMSELLKIKCEFCENLMSVKEELVGKKVKCSKCATVIEVMAPEVESSEEEKPEPEPKPAAEAGGGGFHMTRMISAPTFKRKNSSGKKKVEVTKDKTPLIIGGILVFVTLIVILLVLWLVVLKKPKDAPIVPKATPGAPAPVK